MKSGLKFFYFEIWQAPSEIPFFMQNSDPDIAKHTGRQKKIFQTGFEVAFLHKEVEFNFGFKHH